VSCWAKINDYHRDLIFKRIGDSADQTWGDWGWVDRAIPPLETLCNLFIVLEAAPIRFAA
jgi:hypothetical protein